MIVTLFSICAATACTPAALDDPRMRPAPNGHQVGRPKRNELLITGDTWDHISLLNAWNAVTKYQKRFALGGHYEQSTQWTLVVSFKDDAFVGDYLRELHPDCYDIELESSGSPAQVIRKRNIDRLEQRQSQFIPASADMDQPFSVLAFLRFARQMLHRPVAISEVAYYPRVYLDANGQYKSALEIRVGPPDALPEFSLIDRHFTSIYGPQGRSW